MTPPTETPESLLVKLQALELEFGRLPQKQRNAPRVLDLDLIAMGSQIRDTPFLILPHPRATERAFVLQPLAEIVPNIVLPGQSSTIIELLQRLPSGQTVIKALLANPAGST
jgi:2-amino-4-hydroxy-6-hydroxymethyldihydropteridine diphosphokinase